MNIVVELLLITLIGNFGNILFRLGGDLHGPLNLKEMFTSTFIVEAATSKWGWIILVSLTLNFTSRILLLSPLTQWRYAIVWSVLSALGGIISLLIGTLLFHEQYTPRELTGILLAVIGVWLMGGRR